MNKRFKKEELTDLIFDMFRDNPRAHFSDLFTWFGVYLQTKDLPEAKSDKSLVNKTLSRLIRLGKVKRLGNGFYSKVS